MAGHNVIAPEGLSFAVLRDAIEQVRDVDIVELRERRRSKNVAHRPKKRRGCCLTAMIEAKSCDHKSLRRQRIRLTWRQSWRRRFRPNTARYRKPVPCIWTACGLRNETDWLKHPATPKSAACPRVI